ncbi:MAG TPA: FUSC family protein [Acidocella sp.]|uniref:FUSC family protein n=1 Tax=Acidocella sp. TaxID=50710 RepID=UPI002C6911CE|nr:FUSC family protein [Acidocella sp.]HVE23233.1 FUSC family protein [Acidocella sp.]
MPKPDEITFALKTFLGAMAALYVAFWLGLSNPYWAMATAYIVANPFTGPMRSKAIYRFFGTLTGGAAAVALVPNLVGAPLLLSLALSLWVGLCLYISLLDRTPRAYGFMLAGYTAAIIGFPSVDSPQLIFQTALTRVEEITLGIVCTTMVGTVVFPRAIGPVLARRIAAWMKPAIDWTTAALGGREAEADIGAARRHLAVEATDVAMMTTHLAYDTSHLQNAVRYIVHLRIYVLSLMPVLSAINDRVAELHRRDGMTPALQQTLDGVRDWVQVGGPESDVALRAQIRALETDAASWSGLLRAGLARRLEELTSLFHQARIIRRHIVDGDPAPDEPLRNADYLANAALLRDHGMALLSAFAAFLATLLTCLFWIGTSWPAGGTAALLVAIACSFFAGLDDPAPALASMLRDLLVISVVNGLYLFVILPRVETFAALCLVLLPAALVIGVLVSRPATFIVGMNMGAFGPTILALNNGYTGDFAGYANGDLAIIGGVATGLVVTRLIRSVGGAWSASRLQRAAWRDIATVAQTKGASDRAVLTGAIVQRLGQMMPRLAAVSSGADEAAAALLRDLRAGLNMIELQNLFDTLPPAAQRRTDEALSGIAAFYARNPRQPPPQAVLTAIDAAMRSLAFDAGRYGEALMLLSGLRIVLFTGAPPPQVESWRAAPNMELLA